MRKPNSRKQRNLQWRFYRNMRKHRANTLGLEKQVRALKDDVNTLMQATEEQRKKINEIIEERNAWAEFFREYFKVGEEKKAPFIIRVWKEVFAK
ncbi:MULTISPECIES: hypothetical protein [Pasteurellaceae]|uniref:Uncharacterized protein n=1 Tax=Pasteurella atlantica TaxID=2827233 RepID=A0AAW8CG55_9PAST|nr:hypothetical protein [Pasteurella atlantica]MBR0573376.1 hypothetical protein [Pasteurella atlantica]MDP8039816.1 hypothetical protein [Pasteurella atlantica]MDP8041833.1 hypothetical protein [Pasteurella atlantica]MDP8043900.1 hypothetical protein [Pasteurella atlantica]MDP8046097.1 hypothetical protein [Pasteurella atlantica]